MTVAVFLAVLSPVAARLVGAAATGRFLADHLRPAVAAFVLATTAAVLALTSCVASGLLVALGVLRWDPLTAGATWTLVRGMPADRVTVLSGVLAVLGALLLTVSAVRVVRMVVCVVAQYRVARSIVAGYPAGSVVVRRDLATTARALPVRGGHVLVDAARWAAMGSALQRVVLAHERSHLRHRHDLHLLVGALCRAVNPLLAPVTDALAYALERWADEDAAREIGDRPLVARTLATVALDDAVRPAPLLAVAGGVVPRRVAALLGPAGSGLPSLRGAIVTAGLVVGLLATIGVCWHAWVDLLEILDSRGSTCTG